MITAGSRLTSFSQINRALSRGFTVVARLILLDPIEDAAVIWCEPFLELAHLHESAYEQLAGIDRTDCGPFDSLTMYWCYWEFVVTED